MFLTDLAGSKMKKQILGLFFSLLAVTCTGQAFSCDNLLNFLSLNDAKQESQFSKKGFAVKDISKVADTSVKVYEWNIKAANKKLVDSVKRRLIKRNFPGSFTIAYQTGSFDECKSIKEDLLKRGFYYLTPADQITDTTSLLFQHQSITAKFSTVRNDSTILYSFQFYKKEFPNSADMYYADDLLNFTSHEYLVYFFGEQNVKKDVCFFSDDQIAKCSVLFLNTNRQVVFIWDDEVNRQAISSLLIGGQQKLKSQQDYDKYIAENNWLLKSGIHAGMSLYELRLLNGADIHFYGGNAVNTGEVLAKNEGKINFKIESVILGCMNCRDNKFSSSSVISADDALKDGRILFVLSIVVKPPRS